MSVDALGIAVALGVAVGCGLIPLAVLLHRVAAPSPAGAAVLWLAGLAASVAAPSIVLVAALTRVRPPSQGGWGPLGTTVFILVCAVAAIGIGRLGVALARVRALKLAATRVDTPFALARDAALRISGEAPAPLAIGFRRPSVIIPAAVARTVDDVELAMIVGHENAHLARLGGDRPARAFWHDDMMRPGNPLSAPYVRARL